MKQKEQNMAKKCKEIMEHKFQWVLIVCKLMHIRIKFEKLLEYLKTYFI